jgi:undecaprenyl-diphosphatase
VLYGSFAVIATAFVIGGVIMLVVERRRPVPDVHDVDSLPVGRAFAVGAWQALALVPGVSRSGGTIVAAMAMRVDRAAAAEFTFFLAMPTMAAAFAHDLLEVRHDLASARGLEIAIGFVMAFLSSALVVRPFLNYVRRSGFQAFAWYRIAAGAALFVLIAMGWGR